MAKADHANARKQLSLSAGDGFAAVLTVRNLADWEFFGFVPGNQPFGSSSAFLHRNGVSGNIAPSACHVREFPCVGYHDDYGGVAPLGVISDALGALNKLNDLIRVAPKQPKSETGSKIGFSGKIAHSAESNPNAIARLSTWAERVCAAAEPLVDTTRAGSVFSLARRN